MKKIQTLIAVAGLVAAGVVAWWWQRPSAPAPVASGSGGLPSAGAPAMSDATGPATTVPGARPAGPGGVGGSIGPGGAGGPPPVEVARAEAITIVDDVQAVGSLKSSQGVVLRPEVSGRIARLGFQDGQRVRRGQLMVQLDDTLQRAQLEQAKAQASIARTNLTRSRELLAQNFVSQSAVDQNAANLQVAEAQVALAEAQLARMRILAPFDGTVGLRLVDVGDYVKDGADLVTLQDLSSMEVEFALPERYVGRTRPGLAVDIAFDALSGQVFKGQVVALNSQVDANGRSLLVRARVQNSGVLLKPGMFARPRVVFAVREGAILVPEEALVPQGARQFIYKVVEAPDGRRLARRFEAKVGLRMPGKVEILQGLGAGDLVVTAGQARLRGEETPVRVIDLSRPAGGAAAAAAGGRPAAAASAPGAGGTTAGSAGAPGAASAPSANGRRGPLQP